VGQRRTRFGAAPQKDALVPGMVRTHTAQRGRCEDRVNVEPAFSPPEEAFAMLKLILLALSFFSGRPMFEAAGPGWDPNGSPAPPTSNAGPGWDPDGLK
jgi:hypothetical protein